MTTAGTFEIGKSSEIEERTASNEVRTYYLDKCKKKSAAEFTASLTLPEDDLVGTLRNYIFHEGVNQSRARLLLTIYGYLTSPGSFNVFTQKEIRKTDIDHFIPRAWMANWESCGDVTKQMIVEEFRSQVPVFGDLDVQSFVSAIEQNDVPLKFVPYQGRPFEKERQLLEFIGNRWLLSERINRASSNGDFLKKRHTRALATGFPWIQTSSEFLPLTLSRGKTFAFARFIC